MKETHMHTLSLAFLAPCTPGLLSWLTGSVGQAGKSFHTDPTSAQSHSHAYNSHTCTRIHANALTRAPKKSIPLSSGQSCTR